MVKTGLQAMHLLPEDEGEGGEEGGAEDEEGEEQPALLRVRNRLHLLRHQVIGGHVSHMMSRDFFPVAATPQLTSTLSTKPTPKVSAKFLLCHLIFALFTLVVDQKDSKETNHL